MNLKELLKGISYEYDFVNDYVLELENRCEKIKERNEENGVGTYKINPISGKNSYIETSLMIGEIRLLLEKYKQCFIMVENAIVNGTNDIDLNNDIIQSVSKHMLENGKFNPINRCDGNNLAKVKGTVDLLISPYINEFGRYMKILDYYVLTDYVNFENLDIDVQGIFKELDDNEDDYTSDEIKEIKEAVKYIGTTIARQKNSKAIKLDHYLLPTKLDENLEIKNVDNIYASSASSKEIVANQMIDAMVKGQLDTNGQPIIQNQEMILNNRTKGFAKIWLLGIFATITSIGIILLGIILNV